MLLSLLSFGRCLALAAGLLACAHAASADILLQDTFSRSGSIAGTQTEVGGITYYNPPDDTFSTNGSRLNVSGLHSTVGIPFTVPTGVIIEASIDLQVPASADINWLAFGFRSNSQTPAFSDSSPWVYVRGNGQVEARAATYADDPEIFTRGRSGTAGALTHLDLYLDTRQAQWQVSLYLNGLFDGSYIYDIYPNPNISYIYMGHDYASGSFDNLKVQTVSTVPEPATFSLCALGGLSALARRRVRAADRK